MVAGFLLIFSLILIAALAFVFWLIMLIDSITRKFKDSSEKIIWVIVNVFLGLLGALIYYFVVFIKDKNKSIKWFWWTLLILVVLAIVFFIVWISNPQIVY
ncbi:MAG TPA: PLDc N-terminal domain-containing protein [Candidatus Nanoarchaeia archaeon]|nr:PLDc N-terminal domain-containing protein [Candidatus Nanoarchaeia archaeon]